MHINIRVKRNEKKITQQQLADKCNISRETLSRIENRKQTPSLKLLYRISDELGITIVDLLGNESA